MPLFPTSNTASFRPFHIFCIFLCLSICLCYFSSNVVTAQPGRFGPGLGLGMDGMGVGGMGGVGGSGVEGLIANAATNELGSMLGLQQQQQQTVGSGVGSAFGVGTGNGLNSFPGATSAATNPSFSVPSAPFSYPTASAGTATNPAAGSGIDSTSVAYGHYPTSTQYPAQYSPTTATAAAAPGVAPYWQVAGPSAAYPTQEYPTDTALQQSAYYPTTNNGVGVNGFPSGANGVNGYPGTAPTSTTSSTPVASLSALISQATQALTNLNEGNFPQPNAATAAAVAGSGVGAANGLTVPRVVTAANGAGAFTTTAAQSESIPTDDILTTTDPSLLPSMPTSVSNSNQSSLLPASTTAPVTATLIPITINPFGGVGPVIPTASASVSTVETPSTPPTISAAPTSQSNISLPDPSTSASALLISPTATTATNPIPSPPSVAVSASASTTRIIFPPSPTPIASSSRIFSAPLSLVNATELPVAMTASKP